MALPRLRDITPKGLYARSLAMLIVPILLLLGLTTYYYFFNHIRDVNAKLSQSIAREVSVIGQVCARDAETRNRHAYQSRLGMLFDCDYARGLDYPANAQDSFFYDDVLRDELTARTDYPAYVQVTEGGSVLDIRSDSPNGVIRVLVDRKRALAINSHFFIVWVILFALAMVGLGIAFLRQQVRSILRLSEAAKAFGRGREDPEFRPSGATEVRDAARAVLDMKNRLTAFASQRTAMLAGVSHDLRTPLTRLKLQLAMMDQNADIQAARADLDDMAAMLDEYLAFASGEEGEQPEMIHLDAMLREIASGFGPHIQLGHIDGVQTVARPLAVKRAITNLIGNAVKYGTEVQVSLTDGPKAADILIDDNGPGIPAERREEAFRAFARLDDARTQNTSGTGLGLTLARDTARAHGGDLRLEDSPMGGLRARLRLPH